MPTYEYECSSCKHTFEFFQSMLDAPLEKCPKCGKKVRRLIGGGMGIFFKGSGFYSTDNKNGGNGSKSGSDSAQPSADKPAPAASGSGTSSESKDTSTSTKKKETVKADK